MRVTVVFVALLAGCPELPCLLGARCVDDPDAPARPRRDDDDDDDDDDDGEGEGEDGEGEEGEGDGGCDVFAPACDGVVDCRDAAADALGFHDSGVDRGAVVNAVGADGFVVDVDATAGGAAGDGGYVYARFSDDGLVQVAIDDAGSLDDAGWDIAFRRFIVRLNSGASGPGCVSAARVGTDAGFDDVGCVDVDGLAFGVEDTFVTDQCEVIPDGSGLPGAPDVRLASWWNFPAGCIATTGAVFVVVTGDGRAVKLTVDAFYGDVEAQQRCNDTGEPSGTAARLQLRYAYL